MTDLVVVPQPGDPLARPGADQPDEGRLTGRRPLRLTRSVRHRIARRGLSPYLWGCVPVISPYLDRLRAAAFEPCWRTSREGREYVAALERVLGGRCATSNEVAQPPRATDRDR